MCKPHKTLKLNPIKLDFTFFSPYHFLQLFRDKAAERSILSLSVKCINWKRKCEWTGDLSCVEVTRTCLKVFFSHKNSPWKCHMKCFFFFFFQILLISIIFVKQNYHLYIAKYNSQLNWWPLPKTSPGVKTFLVLIIRSSKLNITCRKAFVLSKFKKKNEFQIMQNGSFFRLVYS